ncbi:MAG TPA: hypothetical protein VN937_03730 [Blastocatellia bacterium]|nr:hypothetical protein [Blastocatellia bacterium]
MGISTLSFLLFIVLGLFQTAETSDKVDLGQEFKIKNGEEVVVRDEKVRIKFRSVPMDSRCPSDVVCGWAGNGEVVVEVVRKNKKQRVATLNTLLDPKEIVYKGFKVRLVALNPYPKVSDPINPKDYEATMIVTKEE